VRNAMERWCKWFFIGVICVVQLGVMNMTVVRSKESSALRSEGSSIALVAPHAAPSAPEEEIFAHARTVASSETTERCGWVLRPDGLGNRIEQMVNHGSNHLYLWPAASNGRDNSYAGLSRFLKFNGSRLVELDDICSTHKHRQCLNLSFVKCARLG